MELEIKNLEALPQVVADFLPLLKKNRHFLLYGEMGVGKTTFINEVLHQLGIPNTSGSPTYSLINSYQTDKEMIYHIDLYRLKSAQEVFDIGLEEILDSDSICFIEWPQLVEKQVEANAIALHFKIDANFCRKIDITTLP